MRFVLIKKVSAGPNNRHYFLEKTIEIVIGIISQIMRLKIKSWLAISSLRTDHFPTTPNRSSAVHQFWKKAPNNFLPIYIYALPLTGAIVALMCMILTTRFKISLHAAGSGIFSYISVFELYSYLYQCLRAKYHFFHLHLCPIKFRDKLSAKSR